jgi:hypothetical protein
VCPWTLADPDYRCRLRLWSCLTLVVLCVCVGPRSGQKRHRQFQSPGHCDRSTLHRLEVPQACSSVAPHPRGRVSLAGWWQSENPRSHHYLSRSVSVSEIPDSINNTIVVAAPTTLPDYPAASLNPQTWLRVRPASSGPCVAKSLAQLPLIWQPPRQPCQNTGSSDIPPELKAEQ